MNTDTDADTNLRGTITMKKIIIIKPETLVPDLDLETSGDLEGDGR